MGLAAWLGFTPKQPPGAPFVAASALYDPVFTIDGQHVLDGMLSQPIEKLWREQPHLRTVVGFIARNIAQLGLHAYERDDDDGRNRQRDTDLAKLIEQPNSDTTTYELIFSTVASLCLYDIAYWYIAVDLNSPSGWVVRHLPNTWILGTIGGSAFAVDAYKVAIPNNTGQWSEIPAEEMLVFHGWNPVDVKTGSSPVHALKTILAEQISSQIYREQMWKRGGRVGSYIFRPADAPEWSDTARDKWVQQYRESYSSNNGPKAGGEPLFEDGMELKRVGFSAKDDQYIEAAKLSLETCAQVYYLNPTMVGILDNANYSNVREFRRMLYGDSLGPAIEHLSQRINRFVVPRVTSAATAAKTYVEFNLQAKLAGSFEEQAAVMQSAIGGPWMTVNEGRAKQNMPAIDSGDELIRPLNVTAAGDQNPIPAEEEQPTAEEPGVPTEEKRNGHAVRILV